MDLPHYFQNTDRINSYGTFDGLDVMQRGAIEAYDGFTLHALQPGAAPDGVEPFPAYGNFADVADRIARMRHIVSVDTAAIHLAGAMGHPSAHLVLPRLMDWRWWHSGLWYPRLKTYRQNNATDWSAPFARLNEVLHGEARGPRD